MVRGVLVCACACVWVAAATAAEVRQEVDRIFKTVESVMSGEKKSDLPIGESGPRTKKSHMSDVSPGVSERAYPGPGSGTAAFPVGVILSDNLYPLVVGRNLETGMPFVMNLNKQHALVVARGGSPDYRMVIPFPVVVNTPRAQDDSSESQYRSPPPKRYPLKTPYYPSHGPNTPKKYLANHQTYGKYYDGPSHTQHDAPLSTQHDAPLTPRDPHHAHGPSKVPVKYASNYQSYRNGYDADDARYKQSPPKKYVQKTNYINYFGVDHKPVPAVSGKYIPYSIDHPVPKYRVKNYTRFLSPSGELSYHVTGPKYNPESHFSQNYNSQAQLYRTPSQDGSPPRLRYQQYSPPPPQPYNGDPGHSDDDLRDFKPSQYLGAIPEDEPSTTSPLETQSEEFESYDDREPDYIETTSGRGPSSSVGVESSGGVRHVTHHADDYLGKIYEDMYYKVAPSTYPDGPPSYEAEESHSHRLQLQRNATDVRTGPVTFDSPDRE